MESPTESPTSHAIDHDSLVYRILHKIGRPWHFQISQPLIYYNMLCRRPHLNRMVMKQHMVERPVVDLFTLHSKACDHTNWSGHIVKWPLGRTSNIQCFLPGSKNKSSPKPHNQTHCNPLFLHLSMEPSTSFIMRTIAILVHPHQCATFILQYNSKSFTTPHSRKCK